jgi:hypothetical protein
LFLPYRFNRNPPYGLEPLTKKRDKFILQTSGGLAAIIKNQCDRIPAIPLLLPSDLFYTQPVFGESLCIERLKKYPLAFGDSCLHRSRGFSFSPEFTTYMYVVKVFIFY